MGYTTDFDGHFTLDKPLTQAHADYLNKFSSTRRVQRQNAELPDPLREAVGLPMGVDGGYYVNAGGFHGQAEDESIVNYNMPPEGQPGLWCQWVVTKDNNGNYTKIEWDGGEKFYNYIEWINYIIEHFLMPWGYTLNGVVKWRGEDFYDIGTIVIVNNVVITKHSF
jgi:hypothetical protein